MREDRKEREEGDDKNKRMQVQGSDAMRCEINKFSNYKFVGGEITH